MNLSVIFIFLTLLTTSCQNDKKSKDSISSVYTTLTGNTSENNPIDSEIQNNPAPAEEMSCKTLIVKSQAILGKNLNENEFSTLDINNYKIKPEDFNALSVAEQRVIYLKLKPLSLMLEETLSDVNSYITKAASSAFGFLLEDDVKELKNYVIKLKSCLQKK